MRDEEALLRDMLESAQRIQREIGNTTYDSAKSISEATRLTLPGLPFDDIARMRNFMAHVLAH